MTLGERLRAAHDAGAPAPLAALYAEAAGAADGEAAAFYLTHAWIFALDAGLPEAAAYEDRLRRIGRA